ncbi:phenylalanine ammonia-lyase [Apiospora aurea]|uniref:Phenylalanine ammonia-lyase n=1 Tax=Apiospora aurea TaxID=335848 RepID=A0ABR1PV35_9PEZI
MQDLLTHNIIPMMPLRGSSGDLSPLSYITGAIQGKCTIRILSKKHQGVYVDTAFMESKSDPVAIQAKEGLGMTNGTAISAAVGALVLYDTHGLAFLAQILTAMTVEGLHGTTESFHTFFSQTRPHPGQRSPPNLVAEDPNLSFIFKGTDLNIAALTAELGFLAHPMNHMLTAEMGNQSLNSLALVSARYTNTANEVLAQLMAAHMIAVCQALDLRAMHLQFLEPYKPHFFELVAAHFPVDREATPSLDGEAPSSRAVQTPPDLSINHRDGDQSGTPNMTGAHQLPTLLWSRLLLSFDATAGMDSQGRFIEVAMSMHSTLLGHSGIKSADITRVART